MFEWRHSDSPSPNLPGNTLFAEGRHRREGRNATLGTKYGVQGNVIRWYTTLAPAVIRDMHLLDQSRALVCVLPFPPPNQLYIHTYVQYHVCHVLFVRKLGAAHGHGF